MDGEWRERVSEWDEGERESGRREKERREGGKKRGMGSETKLTRRISDHA